MNEEQYRLLLEIAQRQARELALLEQVHKAVASQLNLQDLFRTTVDAIVASFGYTQVSLYLLQGGLLRLQYEIGYDHLVSEISVSEGVSGRVVRTALPVLVENVQNDPDYLAAIQGVVSEVCVPLFDDGQMVGVLNVESTQGVKLTDADLRLLTAISEQVGIAISKARLYTEVRESEERYRDLIHKQGEGIAIVDPSEVFTFTNPAAEIIFGVQPGSLVGRSLREFTTPEQYDAILQQTEKRRFGDVGTYEMEIVRPDEEHRNLLVTVTPRYYEDNQYAGGFGIFRDITVRKRAESDLRDSEERFHSVFNNASVGMALEDINGFTLVANEAQCRFLGYSHEEIVGMHYSKFIFSEDLDIDDIPYKTMIEGETDRYTIDKRFIRKDEMIVWGRLSISLVRDIEGRILYKLIVCEDINEKKRAEEALERNVKQMAALYETSLEIGAKQDLSSLLTTIVERAVKLVGARMGGLYLVEPDGKNLNLVISYNLPKNYAGTKLHLGEGLAGRVAQNGKPLNVADYLEWEGRAETYADSGFRRVLGTPLKVGDRVIGVLDIVDIQQTTSFSEDEVRLVNLFANQASIAIENARIFEETEQRALRLALVQDVSIAINQSLELKTVLQTVLDGLAYALKVDQAGLALFDDTRQHLMLVADHPAPGSQSVTGIELPLKTYGAVLQVLDTKKSVYVANVKTDPAVEAIHDLLVQRNVASILIVPLVVRDEVIGTIACDCIGVPRRFTVEELLLAETVANLAALRIEQARLYAELQRKAIVDELTNLYNYRGMVELGTREFERAHRFNRPLSVIFFDIDHFREFNNRYSHSIGNQILRAVAQRTLSSLRVVDLVTRFGGEEFVAFLPETDIIGAIQVAERLRQDVEKMLVTTEKGELGVTVSVGVTEMTADISDLATLIDRANQAEHTAKEQGRNCVAIGQSRIDVYKIT